jgi:integrase
MLVLAEAFKSRQWAHASSQVHPSHKGLLMETMRHVAASRASSTLKQYVTPWSKFSAWCFKFGYVPIPAPCWVVALYLTEMIKNVTSYCSVKACSAAIYNAHRLAGYLDTEIPTKHPHVKAVRDSAKRTFGTKIKNRKDPIDLEVCLALVELLAYPKAPLHLLMLATAAMTCFAGFLRYSDISKLKVSDVKFYSTHAELFLNKRKNDQFRQGDIICIVRGKTSACPVVLLERFLKEGVFAASDPLFQGFDGHAARWRAAVPLNGEVITYSQLHGQLTRYWAKLLNMELAACTKMLGLHSLRSGGATLVAKKDVPERLFQAHGGWKDRSSMMVYLKEGLEAKLQVTTVMGY